MTQLLLQQVCSPGQDFTGYMTNFEFIKAFTCPYFDAAGVLVTGLLVYGAVAAHIYIRTDSVLIPLVLVLVIGGAVLSQIANLGLTIAVVILLVGGGGALTLMYYRYAR